MLSVSVRLLHGTVRAASHDDLGLTGELDTGDWPPSPARLVAALVAADGTRSRCRVTDGSELAILENARAPRIYAAPDANVLRSSLRPRYVVGADRAEGAVHEYPARTSTELRPGTRLAPIDNRIIYVWDDITATSSQVEALQLRAARVAYLGCADSPAQVTVGTEFHPDRAPKATWEPDPLGDAEVPVPFAGYVDILDRIFDQWTDGKPVRRVWYPTDLRYYRSPDAASVVAKPPPSVVWLRFERSISGHFALRVSEAL